MIALRVCSEFGVSMCIPGVGWGSRGKFNPSITFKDTSIIQDTYKQVNPWRAIFSHSLFLSNRAWWKDAAVLQEELKCSWCPLLANTEAVWFPAARRMKSSLNQPCMDSQMQMYVLTFSMLEPHTSPVLCCNQRSNRRNVFCEHSSKVFSDPQHITANHTLVRETAEKFYAILTQIQDDWDQWRRFQ